MWFPVKSCFSWVKKFCPNWNIWCLTETTIDGLTLAQSCLLNNTVCNRWQEIYTIRFLMTTLIGPFQKYCSRCIQSFKIPKIPPSWDSYWPIVCNAKYYMSCILRKVFYSLYSLHSIQCIVFNKLNFMYFTLPVLCSLF